MLLNYHILTQVRLRHSFFSDGLAKGIQFIPSKDTLKKCNNLGLISKKSGSTISILAATDDSSKTKVAAQLSTPFTLTFYLQLTDPNWRAFTALNSKIKDTLFFSNINSSTHNTSLLLHQEEFVTSNNIIKTISEGEYPLDSLTLKFPKLIAINVVSTKEKAENIVNSANNCSYALKKRVDKKGNVFFVIATALLEEGLYELMDFKEEQTAIGETIDSFFVQKNTTDFYGICHLIISPDGQNDNSIINENREIQSTNFEISFLNKSTYWRYLFTKDNLSQFDGLAIIEKKQELTQIEDSYFAPPQDIILPNGRNMLTFTSKKELSITQKPHSLFQLKKNVGIADRTPGIIMGGLPTPQIESLYRINEDGNLFSDIYIYM